MGSEMCIRDSSFGRSRIRIETKCGFIAVFSWNHSKTVKWELDTISSPGLPCASATVNSHKYMDMHDVGIVISNACSI